MNKAHSFKRKLEAVGGAPQFVTKGNTKCCANIFFSVQIRPNGTLEVPSPFHISIYDPV